MSAVVWQVCLADKWRDELVSSVAFENQKEVGRDELVPPSVGEAVSFPETLTASPTVGIEHGSLLLRLFF